MTDHVATARRTRGKGLRSKAAKQRKTHLGAQRPTPITVPAERHTR